MWASSDSGDAWRIWPAYRSRSGCERNAMMRQVSFSKASPETGRSMKTVTHKTCCELQEYVWIDGALVSVADMADVQREEMAERSARSRIPRMTLPGDQEPMPPWPRWMPQGWAIQNPYHSQL